MWDNVYPEEAARRLFKGLKQVGECFEWQGYTNPKGYGHISIKGKQRYTHRVIIEIVQKRLLRADEIVCHHPKLCNNPRCCNPEHLRVGSLMDNVADRVEAGVKPKKVRERKRLTVAQVLMIRLRLKFRPQRLQDRLGYQPGGINHRRHQGLENVARSCATRETPCHLLRHHPPAGG